MHLTPKSTTHGKLGKTGRDYGRGADAGRASVLVAFVAGQTEGSRDGHEEATLPDGNGHTTGAHDQGQRVHLFGLVYRYTKGLALNSTKPRRILERFSHDLYSEKNKVANAVRGVSLTFFGGV